MQESKGKGIFLVGGQTGEGCLPYLTNGLKSRFRHWLNRDLEGSFVFLWEYLQRYLSFGNAFLRNHRKHAKKRKKSLEDLAASVSPVIRKARC